MKSQNTRRTNNQCHFQVNMLIYVSKQRITKTNEINAVMKYNIVKYETKLKRFKSWRNTHLLIYFIY